MADPPGPLDNAYTARDLAFLESQGLSYMLLVKGQSRQQPNIFMKNAGLSIPYAIELLKSMTAPQPPTESELTDIQKEKFPKTPGDIKDIFKDKRRIQGLASELMQFWRTNLGLKMGKGDFKMWDQFKVNTGAMDHCLDLVELARSKLGDCFMITMSQIISWSDMGGMHGLATGNAKRLLVPWSWIDFLKFFICWSYAAVGHDINSWRNTTKTFIKEKVKEKVIEKTKPKEKVSTKTKHVSTEKEKTAGRQAGLKRAMAYKRKSEVMNDEMVMAMAMSVSEDQAKEREKDIEQAEIEEALQKSLNENSVNSAEKKKKKKEIAISKTFPQVGAALNVLRGRQELTKEPQEIFSEDEVVQESLRDESLLYFRTPEKSPVFRKRRRAPLMSPPARSPSRGRFSSDSSDVSLPAEQDQFLSQASLAMMMSPAPLDQSMYSINFNLSDEEDMMEDEQEVEVERGGGIQDKEDRSVCIFQEMEQEKVIELVHISFLTYFPCRPLVSTTPRCPPATSPRWWTCLPWRQGPRRREGQVYGARPWSTRDRKTTSPASTSLQLKETPMRTRCALVSLVTDHLLLDNRHFTPDPM